jgi:hypothetical protein
LEPIRHLQFRYWDGYAWWDTWDFLDLPLGVEISLGLEAWDPGESNDAGLPAPAYPHEIYRRTVYLPGSMASFNPATEDLFTP